MLVSGVETTQPDKETEMFLYELSVDEGSRRQGIDSGVAKRSSRWRSSALKLGADLVVVVLRARSAVHQRDAEFGSPALRSTVARQLA
jgi:hypothetical protein